MLALVLATWMLQTTMPITTIAAGGVSNIMEPREVVVKTAVEWEKLWREHSFDNVARPSVDFAKSMVVGVFLGSRNTGGYDVTITGVEQAQGGLVVRYTEKAPARGAMVAQVITAPFHLVSVPRFDGAVRFERAAPK